MTWALKSLKKFYFNSLLFSKVYVVWAKKYRGVILHETEEGYKIWRGTDLFQNWQKEYDKFWTEHSKVSTSSTLMGSFWAKYIYIAWTKKVERSYLSRHWRVMQNLKKNWLVAWRWHEEFGKFSPEHWKVSKLELWWNPFAQSRKCVTLKFTEELCVMTMKNDTKIEEELTCRFKIDMRNFTNVDPSTRKSKKFVF